jgi:riboflavin transporter FmnP
LVVYPRHRKFLKIDFIAIPIIDGRLRGGDLDGGNTGADMRREVR